MEASLWGNCAEERYIKSNAAMNSNVTVPENIWIWFAFLETSEVDEGPVGAELLTGGNPVGHQRSVCSLEEEPRAHSSKWETPDEVLDFASHPSIKHKPGNRPSDADSCSVYLPSICSMSPSFPPDPTRPTEQPAPQAQCCRHCLGDLPPSQSLWMHTAKFPSALQVQN